MQSLRRAVVALILVVVVVAYVIGSAEANPQLQQQQQQPQQQQQQQPQVTNWPPLEWQPHLESIQTGFRTAVAPAFDTFRKTMEEWMKTWPSSGKRK